MIEALWRFGTWCAVLLLPALSGCGELARESKAAVPPPAKAVEVERVEPRRLTPSIVVPGVVEPKARISLAFRIGGFVEHFHVDEGDRVAAGEVLAELDQRDLARAVRAARASLARARASAEAATSSRERQRELLARKISAPQRYEQARSQHEIARAELVAARVRLEEAEDRLSKTILRAPVSGYIERRLLEVHEPAREATPVLVLSELDPVKVRAAVADARLGSLRIGGPVIVRTPFAPGRDIEGAITRIGVAADPATRTVPFEVELPNPELTLRPESVVEMEIPVGAAEPIVLIPIAAVLRDLDTRPFCFLAAKQGTGLRAERRPVEIGAVHGEQVEVLAGLASGDSLVVQGQHFLRADDPLRVLEH